MLLSAEWPEENDAKLDIQDFSDTGRTNSQKGRNSLEAWQTCGKSIEGKVQSKAISKTGDPCYL
jgi:hypothetical protein